MAQVTAADFKTQVAAMAAALTIAWSDTVKTEVAASLKNPIHPLRQIMQFFIVNNATGVVTANDAYVDAAYAGKYPPQIDALARVLEVIPVLVSAAVADADPSDIVLTFDGNITSIADISVAGTVTTEKTINSISVSGAVVTIVVSSPYIMTDTITVSGTFSSGLDSLTLTAEAVTNNVL